MADLIRSNLLLSDHLPFLEKCLIIKYIHKMYEK